MDKTMKKDQTPNDQGDDYLLLDNNSNSNSNNNSHDENDYESNSELKTEELIAELKTTRDDLDHYRNLYDDTFNKLKYSLADFDNYRKNIEKQNTLRILSVKAEMLSTIINLREDFVRALDTLKHHKVDITILEGLTNILKNVDIYLEKEDVKDCNYGVKN